MRKQESWCSFGAPRKQRVVPDLVQNGRSGLLVPPADPAALAQALKQIKGSPELYNRLADGAYQRTQELQHSWAMVADEALTCLRQWAKSSS